MQTFHSSNNEWICGMAMCGQQFSTATDVDRHYLLHHQTGIFQCDRIGCFFMASTRGPVVEHYERTHKPNNPAVPHLLFQNDGSNVGKDGHPIYKYRTMSTICPEEHCSQVSITKDDYDLHLKDAHGVLKFKCLHINCKKSFKIKYVLLTN